jgi:hypothetical protein
MIKAPIHQEELTTSNIDAPNIRASKYIKQILTTLKGEIDNNTIIQETSLSHFQGGIEHLDKWPIRK